MKKIYEECKIELITLEPSDLITESPEDPFGNELPLFPIEIEGGIEG